MLKRVLVLITAALGLSQCTGDRGLTESGSLQTRSLRATASVSPAQIFTIEKPILHSSDQISISDKDQTIFCQLGELNVPESSDEINFICGYQRPSQPDKMSAFPPAFGLGKLWVNTSRPPTHLWINGVLHFCSFSKKSRLQCFISSTKENNS